MKAEDEKYNKILTILRKSPPSLDSVNDFENEVINKISNNKKLLFKLSDMIDFLFGWVYLGWVRQSFIAASVFLILMFVYQQKVILEKLNFLSNEFVFTGEKEIQEDSRIEKLMMTYRKSGWLLPSRSIPMSDKEMKLMLESVNELQAKYKDLEKLLEDDPELKQLIEKKLNERKLSRINL